MEGNTERAGQAGLGRHAHGVDPVGRCPQSRTCPSTKGLQKSPLHPPRGIPAGWGSGRSVIVLWGGRGCSLCTPRVLGPARPSVHSDAKWCQCDPRLNLSQLRGGLRGIPRLPGVLSGAGSPGCSVPPGGLAMGGSPRGSRGMPPALGRFIQGCGCALADSQRRCSMQVMGLSASGRERGLN